MLDLRQVTFIDSSGLGVIVGQQKRSQEEGSSFSIAVDGASAVQRILDLSGLIKILDVVADPADVSADALRPSGGNGRAALLAGGDVGGDLLAVDWAATPLGPPELWPRSLASIVQVLLSSRFSMWMAWGPELTFLCNDAYRRDTLGKKYPWALGRPAREVWAEIWPDIGPRIETVLRTGEATWDEALLLFLERSGAPRRPTTRSPTARWPTTRARSSGCCAWSPRTPSGSSAGAGWRRCATSAPGSPARAPRRTCWPR